MDAGVAHWELNDIQWDPDQLLASFDGELQHASARSAIPVLLPTKRPGKPPAHAPKPAPVPRVRGPRSRKCERTCLVSGCGGLKDASRYFLRLRLCKEHAHADVLVVDDEERRFCQARPLLTTAGRLFPSPSDPSIGTAEV